MLADRKIRLLPAGDIPLIFSPDFGEKVNRTLPLAVRSQEVLENTVRSQNALSAFAEASGNSHTVFQWVKYHSL
jgi:hypothetical protein